jgi:hypothetical protein
MVNMKDVDNLVQSFLKFENLPFYVQIFKF